MIPILYDSNETAFVSNGLGRLRDCISCKITEERNGIYECDFQYPITGAHFSEIQPGRTVYVSHDDTGNPEPFDIVSYSKPIDGVVSFHAVHISYRLSGYTANGTNINELADALDMLSYATPPMPFGFETDFTSVAYMASADGTPRSVRQFLGGIEGSILDAYGGEYEFTGFRVILHKNRGQARNFSVRYGINMLTFQDDTDYSGTFTSCIPYWVGSDPDGAEVKVICDKVDSGFVSYTGRDECIPLDVSDKFEDMPTKAQVEAMALSIMQSSHASLPAQTIAVSFARLQDMAEYKDYAPLLECRLCDTIPVVFPDYQTAGTFKIVKVVYDALAERYDEMELGTLATSLSQALGISNTLTRSGGGGGGGGGGSAPIPGIVELYAGTVAPAGWLLCDGSEVAKASYPKLAPIIGTTYGTPLDPDNMVLPDFRGRVPVGVGNGTATGHTNHAIGQKAGNENAIIPYHRHQVVSHSHQIGGDSKYFVVLPSDASAISRVSAGSGSGQTQLWKSANAPARYTNTDGAAPYTDYQGASGNTTGANMPPYLAINYIICTGEEV